MSIKHHFVRLAEKIHGRKCSRCAHNRGGKCTNPKEGAFFRCWQSITRPGFEYSPSVECYNNAAAVVAGLEAGLEPGDLTQEEKYQMAKIVESLQEASATARDGGLLGEDDQETEATQQRRAAYWEDKTESGLFEED